MQYLQDLEWLAEWNRERKRLQTAHAEALAEIGEAKAKLLRIRAEMAKFKHGPQPMDTIGPR
jgi:hypothetical protein